MRSRAVITILTFIFFSFSSTAKDREQKTEQEWYQDVVKQCDYDAIKYIDKWDYENNITMNYGPHVKAREATQIYQEYTRKCINENFYKIRAMKK